MHPSGEAGEGPRRPPVVIGATGGSGTRMLHGLLSRLGFFMGVRLNGPGDAMDFEPWLDTWINPILQVTGSTAYTVGDLPGCLGDRVLTQFERCLARYTADVPAGAPWGWKNPRSMFLWPVIRSRFPEARLIHLVRDGRDMAFSANQNQPRKHYPAMFGEAIEVPDPVKAIRLWRRANVDAADWGEGRGGYLRLRFEDVCRDPEGAVAGVARFLELDAVPEGAVEAIARPVSLGRWREQDRKLLAEVEREGAPGLERFGYPLAVTLRGAAP